MLVVTSIAGVFVDPKNGQSPISNHPNAGKSQMNTQLTFRSMLVTPRVP